MATTSCIRPVVVMLLMALTVTGQPVDSDGGSGSGNGAGDEVTAEVAATGAAPCPAGSIVSRDGVTCEPCKKGTTSPGGDATSCTPCPDGHTNAGKGSADCPLCTRAHGGQDCAPCAPGTYSKGGVAGPVCKPCLCKAPPCMVVTFCNPGTGKGCFYGAGPNGGSCKSLGLQGTCRSGSCCVPQTCATIGQCGANLNTGCGGTITCDCPAGAKCMSGRCCTPRTCAQVAQEWGVECAANIDDGCGGKLSCMSCASNALDTCGPADGGLMCRGPDGAAHGTPPLPASVDLSDRAAVVSLFRQQLRPYFYETSSFTLRWAFGKYDGTLPSAANSYACRIFSLPAGWVAETKRLVDTFRLISGLPAVSVDARKSAMAAAGALMMTANQGFSHTPPSTWKCLSDDARIAAARSNDPVGGLTGWGAVLGFMRDRGSGVENVCSRRRLLYPPLAAIGVGSAWPAVAGQEDRTKWAATMIWVDNTGEPGFSTPVPHPPGYIAWPPAGFVPQELVYERWSISTEGIAQQAGSSIPSSGLADAAVNMADPDGAAVPLAVTVRDSRFLVWEPQRAFWGDWGKFDPAIRDQPFQVTISRAGTVIVRYTVTVISTED